MTDTRSPPEAPAVVEITPAQVPAFCPNPAMTLWSSHPRVYLHFDAAGEARCPYCGTLYRLTGGRPPGGH
jgi:uncharacterized Zn-finger protein